MGLLMQAFFCVHGWRCVQLAVSLLMRRALLLAHCGPCGLHDKAAAFHAATRHGDTICYAKFRQN